MSKFILSNNSNTVKRSVIESKNNGFLISGQYDTVKCACATYHKLGMRNINYVQLNDDFVSVVGTCIYREMIGEEMLRRIYSDFNGNINDIRDHIIGNCAVTIKKGTHIYIFGEYLGVFKIYYYNNDGLSVVSNDLYDLCKVCPGLEIKEEDVKIFMTFSSSWTNETIIRDVYALQDNEYLLIDTTTGALNVNNVAVSWKTDENLSYEEAIDKIKETLLYNMSQAIKHYGSVALSSTGGMDNRLNLALCLAAGHKPTLYYGIGNSSVASTDPGDLTVNKIFENKFETPLRTISWHISQIVDEAWNELISSYGFNSRAYFGSRDIYDAYKKVPEDLVLFGYMGELYRSLDFMEKNGDECFTSSEYVDKYLMEFYKFDPVLYKNTDRLRQTLEKRVGWYCHKWNIDPQNIHADDMILFDIQRRTNTDIIMLNMINYHHHCMYVIGQYNVVQYLTKIKSAKKDNAHLQLDLLKSIYPQVLEVPIFSHCRFHVYDAETNTIKDTKKASFIKRFRVLLPTSLRRALKRLFYRKYKDDQSQNKYILSVIDGIFSRNGWQKDIDYLPVQHGLMHVQYSQLAQFIYIAESVGIKIKLPHD